MLLAVNIGNTNMRAAVGHVGCASDISLPINGITQEKSFIEQIELNFGADVWQRLEGSIISSVVPKQSRIITESVLNKTGMMPQRINIQNCGELVVRQYKGLIGEDRVVCCAGALFKYNPPFIVVDFGTATTINIVDDKKFFLGGAILTGVRMGLKALAANTALLPLIDDVDTIVSLIGKSTEECIVSGSIIGTACAVEGYISRIERELGQKTTVIITGGNAPILLPHCHFENIHEPSLLIDSLFYLLRNIRRD